MIILYLKYSKKNNNKCNYKILLYGLHCFSLFNFIFCIDMITIMSVWEPHMHPTMDDHHFLFKMKNQSRRTKNAQSSAYEDNPRNHTYLICFLLFFNKILIKKPFNHNYYHINIKKILYRPQMAELMSICVWTKIF